MNTLAITGATGFLGRHLVSECLSQNRFALRLLTRDRNLVHPLRNGNVTVCEGDLLEPASLEDFLTSECTLIHLAYTNDSHEDNIEAVRNLIDLVKRVGIKRVIHCSTAAVIGFRARGVVTEANKPGPRGEYQRTKLRIEDMLRAELGERAELVILRPTEIFGPGGQGLLSMISRLRSAKAYKRYLLRCILRNRKFNYVSVHNVVAALLFFVDVRGPSIGDIYHVSDDDVDNNYASIEEIINKSLRHNAVHRFDVGLPRPLLACLFRCLPNSVSPDLEFSCEKLTALGYKKVVTLRDAVSELVLSTTSDLS